jgi:hypothetical protein
MGVVMHAFEKSLKRRRKKLKGVIETAKRFGLPKSFKTTAKVKVEKKPGSDAARSEAAKKAWATRRANSEDPETAEAERQEALRILEELAKKSPPSAEE